jgi:hypothetical protein
MSRLLLNLLGELLWYMVCALVGPWVGISKFINEER